MKGSVTIFVSMVDALWVNANHCANEIAIVALFPFDTRLEDLCKGNIPSLSGTLSKCGHFSTR